MVSLPPNIDLQIRKRFTDLLKESEELTSVMMQSEQDLKERGRANGIIHAYDMEVKEAEFYSLRTRFLSLLEFLPLKESRVARITEEVVALKNTVPRAKRLTGIIHGLKDDYEAGMLGDLARIIETNVVSDYLGQAQQLLGEGIVGNFDYVPAAVLAGAVLEDAMRRLCQRQTPPIDINRPNGDPKTLSTYIDDLKKANVYNEAKAKQLRAVVATRNHAAHGEFGEFNRQDVEQMLLIVQNFLADYL